MVSSIFVMWLPAMMNGLVMSSQISCEVIDQLQEEKKNSTVAQWAFTMYRNSNLW